MNTNEDKAVENLVNKIMKESMLESPSQDFTNHIMAQVEALQSCALTKYKPLISKPIWGIIVFAILTTCIYLFLNVPANETTWFSSLNFNALTNNSLAQTLSGFTLPKTFMYALVFLSLMICVQVPLLKNHFNKRFES